MKITIIGRGNIGGGLAKLWQARGHEVNSLGHEGGDASQADIVVLAVPSSAIGAALDNVSGLDGKPVIDTSNAFAGRTPGFESFAHEVKAHTGGPVAKAFNANFASLFDKISAESHPPACLYAADESLQEVTEQLIRDAGYEPITIGGLENARALEDFVPGVLAKIGNVFYRIGEAGEL